MKYGKDRPKTITLQYTNPHVKHPLWLFDHWKYFENNDLYALDYYIVYACPL